jgi:hypothetical protein
VYTNFYVGEIQNFVIILKHDFSAGTTLIMYAQSRKIGNPNNTKGQIKGLNRLSRQKSKMTVLRCLCQTRTVSCHEMSFSTFILLDFGTVPTALFFPNFI